MHYLSTRYAVAWCVGCAVARDYVYSMCLRRVRVCAYEEYAVCAYEEYAVCAYEAYAVCTSHRHGLETT